MSRFATPRKLVTGSDFDVQFNDMKKQYVFGATQYVCTMRAGVRRER